MNAPTLSVLIVSGNHHRRRGDGLAAQGVLMVGVCRYGGYLRQSAFAFKDVKTITEPIVWLFVMWSSSARFTDLSRIQISQTWCARNTWPTTDRTS